MVTQGLVRRHFPGWGALFGTALIAGGWYVRRWITATGSPSDGYVDRSEFKHFFSRLLHGSPLIAVRNGRPRLSRLAVTVLFVVGLVLTVFMVMFVSTATHGLAEYDPLVRFEEMTTAAIDTWLPQKQGFFLLDVAKVGSTLSIGSGLAAALAFAMAKRQLYTFTLLFSLVGGETLSALIAYLNRGYSVFVSTHMTVRLSYLLAYDNVIVPIVMFGMLAYFGVLATKQLLSAVSVIVAFGLLALGVIASGFLGGLHGGLEFFEELLCAVVWLWICIGLTGFIRLRRHQQDALRQIDESAG